MAPPDSQRIWPLNLAGNIPFGCRSTPPPTFQLWSLKMARHMNNNGGRGTAVSPVVTKEPHDWWRTWTASARRLLNAVPTSADVGTAFSKRLVLDGTRRTCSFPQQMKWILPSQVYTEMSTMPESTPSL